MSNEMVFYKTMGSVLNYFQEPKKVHNFLGYILIYGIIILSATFTLSGSLQLGIATLALGYFLYIVLFIYTPQLLVVILIVMAVLGFLSMYALYIFLTAGSSGNSKEENYKQRQEEDE